MGRMAQVDALAYQAQADLAPICRVASDLILAEWRDALATSYERAVTSGNVAAIGQVVGYQRAVRQELFRRRLAGDEG